MAALFEAFVESLGLPEATRLNRRLFKKHFHELTRLTKPKREQFAKAVDAIIWTHTLKNPLSTSRHT
jgi:hypothetical protein